MSSIGSTLTSMAYSAVTSTQTTHATTSVLADQSHDLKARNPSSILSLSLNPRGELNTQGLKTIRTERGGLDRDLAHQSAYQLNMLRNWLQPENFNPPQDVVVDGRGRIETKLNYAELNGWLDDIPVSFTVMMANRTYENTKLVFSNRTKRMDNTTTNRWIM